MPAPDVGDIVWVEFDPVRGSEQAKRRPALVLTSQDYHQRSPRAVVCPISSNPHPWVFNVPLPAGMKTRGAVQVDQIRSIDRTERMFRTIESAPQQLVRNVRMTLAALVEIEAGILLGGDDQSRSDL
jgi:mRNA interferase MazF